MGPKRVGQAADALFGSPRPRPPDPRPGHEARGRPASLSGSGHQQRKVKLSFCPLVRGAPTPHVHGTDARAFTVGGGTGLHVGSPHGVCRKAEKEFPLLELETPKTAEKHQELGTGNG